MEVPLIGGVLNGEKNIGSSEKKPMVREPPNHTIEVARRVITPPNLPAIYSNGFQIALGPVDVRMFLIETLPVSPTEVVDKQLAAIIMTPEALKLLSGSIGIYVKQYEELFGKIRVVQMKPALVKVQANLPQVAEKAE